MGKPRGRGRRAAGLLICLLLTWGILGCAERGDGVREDEIARAQSVIATFRQELQAALREGLREGPEGAIDVCRVKAPQIAAGLCSDGVAVGRTSYRLRNPANAPEPWMKPLLDDYVGHPDARKPRAVRLDDGSVGYVEPIYVQPLCLTCHGSDIAPSIARRLDAAYPNDNGREFSAGDFRGLFWVRLAASP